MKITRFVEKLQPPDERCFSFNFGEFAARQPAEIKHSHCLVIYNLPEFDHCQNFIRRSAQIALLNHIISFLGTDGLILNAFRMGKFDLNFRHTPRPIKVVLENSHFVKELVNGLNDINFLRFLGPQYKFLYARPSFEDESQRRLHERSHPPSWWNLSKRRIPAQPQPSAPAKLVPHAPSATAPQKIRPPQIPHIPHDATLTASSFPQSDTNTPLRKRPINHTHDQSPSNSPPSKTSAVDPTPETLPLDSMDVLLNHDLNVTAPTISNSTSPGDTFLVPSETS